MADTADPRSDAGTGVAVALLAASREALLICGTDGTVRQANAAAEALFGCAPGALERSETSILFPADAEDRIARALRAAAAAKSVEELNVRARVQDGRFQEVNLRAAPIIERCGEVAGFCLTLSRETAGTRSELALTRLMECSQYVGREFCEAMVVALSEILSVRTVLLAEIDPAGNGKARTIAVCNDGQLAPNFDYALQGTPCNDVLTSAACFHADNVTGLFPDDSLLVDMNARAYVGAPLRASDGRVVGLLAAIHDQPLEQGGGPLSILEIFSGRAAAELEREATVTHNEYLGRLIEGSLSEVYVFDARSLCFLLVNKGARENLGYSMAELHTMTPYDIKPDYSADEFESMIQPLLRGETQSLSFRTRHQRKDGSIYPVEVKLQLINGLGAPVFFAAIEDITQRSRAEDALRRTEARLRRLFAQSPAGILETDANGRITLVNRTWCEMLGYSEEELLGAMIFDISEADSIQPTRDALARLAAGTDGLVIEKAYRRKDGTVLHASSNVSALRSEDGRFMGVGAVVLDISERLAAEDKVRESEALLRKVLDGTLAFIGVLEPDGTLIEANVPALAAAGLTREDVVGRKFWDCHWWAYDEKAVVRLKAAVERAAQGTIERYDAVVRMQGDSRMTIDFMLSPVRGADGTVQFLVPSGFDISDRKQQEARIVHLMREVNHRSKNLLTVVQSIVRQMPKSSPEAFTEEFGKRLHALSACQDLLIRSGWEEVPLETLIRSQLMHYSDLLGARITLEGPPVTLSPSAAQTLGMAIYELSTNAAKYGALSNTAGHIRIHWEVEPDAHGQFRLSWQESGGPEVSAPEATGFGSIVVEQLVGMSLEAESKMEFVADGLIWRLNCLSARLHED